MAGRAVEPATREWSIYMAMMRKHRVLGAIAGLLALASLCSCALRLLPVDLQTLPYVSVVLAATPWFAIVSVVSLVLALIALGHRDCGRRMPGDPGVLAAAVLP